MRTEARFPKVPAEDGHYESLYLKAAAPEGGRALWIRHTVHKRPGEAPTGAVWMTWFDAARSGPVAAKHQVGPGEISVPDKAYIRVDESEIAPGRVQGVIDNGTSASWNLRFKDHAGPLHHFPAQWMYERPLPRTKLLSPHPSASFDGILDVAGERVNIEAWPGMVGHNWGSEHAESWIWIHGATIAEDGSRGYVDIAAGRAKLGPLVTPWIVNGEIAHRGERLRVGGLGRALRTRIDAEPTSCRFTVGGEELVANGAVTAPRDRFVAWVYADPSGAEHHSLNCSIADLQLHVSRSGREDISIRVEGAASYEFGTRRTDHGIDVQPFPDG
ncbi:MAG: hypothetical protein R2700_16360 [Solirubrobacterales bacterium]